MRRFSYLCVHSEAAAVGVEDTVFRVEAARHCLVHGPLEKSAHFVFLLVHVISSGAPVPAHPRIVAISQLPAPGLPVTDFLVAALFVILSSTRSSCSCMS